MKIRRIVIGIVMLVLTASACAGSSSGSDSAKLSIINPWVRAAMAMEQDSTGNQGGSGMSEQGTPQSGGEMGDMGVGGATSAAYMVIDNSGGAADRLLSVECDAAQATEIHVSEMVNGVMSMHPVEAIDVPAGGQVELKPGGYHVMLIGIKHDLKAGDKVQMTLNFEKSGKLTVEAEVRTP